MRTITLAILAALAWLMPNGPSVHAADVPAVMAEYDEYAFWMDGTVILDQQSSLSDDGETTYTFNTESGKTYEVLVVCDKDCANLWVSMGSESDWFGFTVTAADEDSHSFAFQNTGQKQIRLQMAECSVSPCAFGVMIIGW